MVQRSTGTQPGFVSARSSPERRFVTRDAAATPHAAEHLVGFRGHAIVYDEWTEVYDWWWDQTYQEQIARGAAGASAAADDVRFLLNHDANYVLARRRGAENDTLRLSEDSVGLLVEAEMDTRISYARDLALALERGDITGMSFAFTVEEESWDQRPDGMWLRTIERVRLYDVAAVTYPAYEGTDGGLRGLLALPDVRSLRRLMASRAGRRNSAADEKVIRSAVDGLRGFADELEGLIEEADSGGDDGESSARAALASNEARRHSAVAAFLGMKA
jgi:HK97 family phage prohead protease